MKYERLWEQIERDALKIEFGKITVEIDMQNGVPVHAELVDRRKSYLCPSSEPLKNKGSIL